MKRPVTHVPPLPAKLRPKKGAWRPDKVTPPLKSVKPSAPSGGVERWLVSHRESLGVICVVWEYSWFRAREKAEGFCKIDRDSLYLEHMPLFEDEKSGETTTLPGWMIANRLGRKLHKDPLGVSTVEPAIFTQCPEWFIFKNGTTSVRCTKEKGHVDGKHRGWRATWRTNGKAQ